MFSTPCHELYCKTYFFSPQLYYEDPTGPLFTVLMIHKFTRASGVMVAFQGQRVVRKRSGPGPSHLLAPQQALFRIRDTSGHRRKVAATMILVSCYFWHVYSFGYWASKTEVKLEELERVSHTEWMEKSSGGRAKRRHHGGPEMAWAWCFQMTKRRQVGRNALCSLGETTEALCLRPGCHC